MGWNFNYKGGSNFYGTYSYGSIELNTSYTANYSYTRIKLVTAHEFGHELGLAHNFNNSRCLMYGLSDGGHVWEAYFNNTDLENKPAQDDIDGINSLY